MKAFSGAALAAGCVLLTVCGGVSANASSIVVPQDTRVSVALKQDLRSGVSRVGDIVRFEVAEDVWSADGRSLLVAAGTPAFGVVDYSSRPGILGQSGKLRFTCDFIQTHEGVRIPVCSGVQLSREGDDNRIQAIFTTLMSNHLGFLTRGGAVVVRDGARFDVSVCRDTAITASQSAVETPIRSEAVSSVACSGPARLLLIRKSGESLVGTCLSHRAGIYRVATSSGTVTVKCSEVRAAYELASTAVPAREFLFLRGDGAAVVGSLLSFDGTAYRIGCKGGIQNLWASDVRSVYGLAS